MVKQERKNGEGILNRLQKHKRHLEKILDGGDCGYYLQQFIRPTEISYLENRFYNLAIAANCYEVKNGNDPTPGNLTEEKESEIEEFIDYAKVIMDTLCYKVFVPYVETAAHSGDDISSDELSGEILHFVRKNINGTGRRTSDGFVVFKGSVLNPKIVKSCPKNAIKHREKYASVINENNT